MSRQTSLRAAAFLAAERQQPMTAAEHAAAAGREAELARDVPRTCICPHTWNRHEWRYERLHPTAGCPWHTGGKQ